MAKALADVDIMAARINHPAYGAAQFERVTQDRRTYYRLTGERFPTMGITTAKGARENITYWQTKGWIVNG